MGSNKHRKHSKRRSMAQTRATHTRRREPATPTLKPSSAETQPQHRWGMRRIYSLVGAAFSVVALVLGLVNDVGGVRSWLQSHRTPDAEIKYFEMKDGRYQLIDPTQVVLYPKYEETSKGYLSVPLNLAVSE
jgi:ferric-dicitrate binding protein FerR (iron transport regulator)